MNKLFFSCFFVFVMLGAVAQDRAVTVRLKLFATPGQLGRLQAAGVSFDHGHYDQADGSYINDFDASEVNRIARVGIRYEVIVQDVMAYNDSLSKLAEPTAATQKTPGLSGIEPGKAPDLQALRLNFANTACQPYINTVTNPAGWALSASRNGFYNLTELEANIDNMVSTYGAAGLITKTSIGNTLEGRPIWVIKISDNAATDEAEPELLYTGMHHSREGMSMMNLMYFMRYLLANYSSNQFVRDLVNSRELFFIPVVNVDGFNFNTLDVNWNAGRNMRRKNMRETTTTAALTNGSGGDGVDLNRNYPQWWGDTYATTSVGQMGSTGGGADDTYRGPTAGSEPETQRMMDFVNSRNFTIALNYHCSGNWWIRAGGPDQVTHPATAIPAANVAVYNSIAALLTRYNCYVYGNPKETVYPVNGFSDDWIFTRPAGTPPVYSFSPEIGLSSDGFWAPRARIEPLARELVFSNLQAAYVAGPYAELVDRSPINLTTTSGAFDFTVTRRGLMAGEVRVSITAIAGISTVGTTVVIPAASLASYGSVFNGSIPFTLPAGLPAGAQIQFTWRLEVGGITMRENVTRIYNPTVVFSDNMDGGNFTTRWVSSTTGSWGYSATEGVGGTSALTESPVSGGNAVNYPNGVTTARTVRLATALDLRNATRVYLSYLIRYDSENCRDRVSVQTSTTGVNGTYANLCAPNTISETRLSLTAAAPAYTGSTDGWVREVVDLSSFAGNSNVGLRFAFNSDAANEEAYTNRNGFRIDDLVITKSNDVTLPVVFESLKVVRQENQFLLLWKAHADERFSHYLVERSGNGLQFEPLVRLARSDVSQYLDRQPLNGSNYYRIRGVDLDGTERFSEIVNKVFEPLHQVSGYPNPVVDVYYLSLYSDRATDARLVVQGADGKVALQRQVRLHSGQNQHQLSFAGLAPQLYLVHVYNNSGVLIHTLKILKNQ